MQSIFFISGRWGNVQFINSSLGLDSLVTFAVNISIRRQLARWWCIRAAKVLVSYPAWEEFIEMGVIAVLKYRPASLRPESSAPCTVAG